MADFWTGFTKGFTPTYLDTRARTDRKKELDRARQELLSDRDIIRQQRLSDMAMDRQQRVDDIAADRAHQAKVIATAQKYAEERERRKIIAALQSNDPEVAEQAREAAFFAQPKEDQDDAMMARGGFPVEGTGIGSDVVKSLESRLEAAKGRLEGNLAEKPKPNADAIIGAVQEIKTIEGLLGRARENQAGEARELDSSRMKGDVGYRDLGDEGLWSANALAARLQKGADAAEKIRADLAALGNQYGLVQGADEPNSAFAAKIEVAKNEAAVTQAGALARGGLDVELIAEGQRFGLTRKENEPPEVFARRVQVAKNEAAIAEARNKAAASAGGTNRGKIRTRSDAALGYMATVGLDSNIREHFAERDENGKIRTDENGEIVDRIDQDTGMPEWRAFLASDAIFNELDELSKKYEEYIGVFGRKPKMLDGLPENMDDIREGRGGRNDLDNRGAAISRLQAEIDREKAKQEDERKVALKKEMDALPKPVLAQLDKLRKAYHAEGADQQAILGNTALLLGSETGAFVDKDQAAAFLESGILAGGEVGEGVKPPTETAAERTQRRTFQSVLTRLDALLDESDKHDWTGVIPTVKAKLLDEIVPIIGIDKYADFERASFRSTASVTAWNLVRSLNEEGRLSDKDAQYLFPLVPTVNDEKPEFRAKLSAIKSLVIDKLQLQASGAGRTDAFSLDPETLLKSVDQPSEEFGGVVQIPRKYALSVIGNMPQYRFIGGDKTKPVTIPYIMGREGLTDDQRFMWIRGANIKR